MKQIKVKFLKENLEFTGEDFPIFAEFERSLIKERQMEGIQLAKKNGVYKDRSPALTENQMTEIHTI